MKARGSDTITVAAAQLAARLMNDAAATLESIGAAIQRAAEKRVDLLVLPECAYPAYLIGSTESYRSSTDLLTSEEYVAWLAERARRHRLHLISGFVEDTGTALHNAAVFIDDGGREIGRTRKRFLWNADHDWFAPGQEIRAHDSKLGRIGIAICAETRDPELLATLAADGAQLIAMPTCWINASRDPLRFENPQVEFMIEARARELRLPFVCADKWGLEMAATGYVGQSRIVRSDGSVAAEAAATGDAVIASRLVLDEPPRIWVSDRRRQELGVQRQHASETPLTVRCEPSAARTTAAGDDDAREKIGVAHPRSTGGSITVAAVPTSVATSRYTGGMGHSLFEPLQKRGVSLLMLNIAHEAQAEQLEMLSSAFDMKAAAFPARADIFELGPARVGCIAGQWARSFATARAMALRGAEILLFFDAPADLPLLRTRAVENRVFVMATADRWAAIIAPDAHILARTTAEQFSEAIAEIDLTQAHDKSVAAKTDVFAERRPELYRY